MGEPMVTDGGRAGLEQSQHHPLAGRSQYSQTPQSQPSDSPASTQGDGGDPTATTIQSIMACVIPGKADEVTRLIRELRALDEATATTSAATTSAATTSAATTRRTSRTSVTDDDPVTIGQLRAILQETLQRPIAATAQHPSYASVARQHAAVPVGNYHIIPERRTRELRIRAENQAEDLARRSAIEVVTATNTAIGTGEVVATRRLPSGDTVLTFKDLIPQSALLDQGWVQRAFGATARLHESEFTVIAKGLPADRITRTNQSLLLLDIQKQVPEVTKLKVEPPRAPIALSLIHI